jgi:acetyl-CoA carboxylase carboxyl transferase subunit alpha
MLEYATYSVITPEGCASILWRDGTRGAEAAEQLRLLAQDAEHFGIIDAVVPEPPGGAHRRIEAAAHALRQRLREHLGALRGLTGDELVAARYQRFRALGVWEKDTPFLT